MSRKVSTMRGFFLRHFFSFLIPAMIFGEGDWQQLNPANAPDARFGHSLVTMPDERVILFGGENSLGDLFDDLHVFEQDNWNQVIPAGGSPSARRDHRAWVRGDVMMLFGGFGNSGELLNDLWSFDPSANTWSQIAYANEPPDPRYNHASWTTEDKDYILGGVGENGYAKNDIWVFDPSTGEWVKKNSCPLQVDDAAVVNHGDDTYILAFLKFALFYNKTEDKWHERSAPDPQPVKSLGMCRIGPKLEFGAGKVTFSETTQTANNAWLFGGLDNENNVLNETWSYDFTTGTYLQHADMPVGLANGASTWINDQIMIFGGIKEDGSVSGETYLYTPPTLFIVSENQHSIPQNFALFQNYPNPFNPNTTISYSLSKESAITITIYDILGKEINQVISQKQPSGKHAIQWDGTDHEGIAVSASIYFYQLQSDEIVQTKKMLLMK